MPSHDVVLSKEQQLELSRIAQSRSLPAGYVFRARLILMLAEGAPFSTIKQRLRTTAPTISRWKQRFLASGIDGLDTCMRRWTPRPAAFTERPLHATPAATLSSS
ncbi:MAG TPA: helix-turn-helix domain-containing protein [Edaphobacter sp.]|nr:helix-turn-helix domain-containing protein [Edaphobacter sp.]